MKNDLYLYGLLIGIATGLTFSLILFGLYEQPETIVEYKTKIEYREIGYINCYKDSGTGPWNECGDMEVRCYSKRGAGLIPCPTDRNPSIIK